jgi:hypothetical protein
LTFVDEIPARNTAKTSVCDVAAADADRFSTVRAATVSRRPNQAAVAGA